MTGTRAPAADAPAVRPLSLYTESRTERFWEKLGFAAVVGASLAP